MSQDQFDCEVTRELWEIDLVQEYQKQNEEIYKQLVWNDVLNSYKEIENDNV